MATVPLTVRYLDQLHSHGKRFEVFDAVVPGLAIRVSAAGRKTSRCTTATTGACGGSVSGATWMSSWKRRGRSRPSTADASLMGPIPPATSSPSTIKTEHTVPPLYERYRSQKEKNLRSWSEVRRIMEREVLPIWWHRRVVDIRRRDVRELVEHKARIAPIQANRVLQRISAMLTFAMDQDWIEANPAWRVKKPGRERSRDRVLTREERVSHLAE
jgi:Phage integrase central domain